MDFRIIPFNIMYGHSRITPVHTCLRTCDILLPHSKKSGVHVSEFFFSKQKTAAMSLIHFWPLRVAASVSSSRCQGEWNSQFFSEAVLCLHFKLNIPSPAHKFAYMPLTCTPALVSRKKFVRSLIYSCPSAQNLSQRFAQISNSQWNSIQVQYIL